MSGLGLVPSKEQCTRHSIEFQKFLKGGESSVDKLRKVESHLRGWHKKTLLQFINNYVFSITGMVERVAGSIVDIERIKMLNEVIFRNICSRFLIFFSVKNRLILLSQRL